MKNIFNDKIVNLKIAVVGDIMLDNYYYGEVKRISPEAPVPVNKVNSESFNLGGAANVAANLVLLGAKVFMGGVAGDDANGKKLEKLMQDISIDSSGVVFSNSRQTTTKMRVIGSNQQMLRLDFEEALILSTEEEKKMQTWFSFLIKQGVNGLIISDYAKGVCTDSLCQWLINEAIKNNIFVLVDPKGNDWTKYKNASFITPNLKELGEVANKALLNKGPEVLETAQDMLEKYQVQAILVTRSEKGVTYVAKDKFFTVPSTAQEVYDVSGAGDTVAAVFLLAMAGGLEEEQAAFIANEAAAVVVARIGTYAISKQELFGYLLEKEKKEKQQSFPLNYQDIKALLEVWRDNKEKIVFTNGCFDLLHKGHVAYLEKAAKLGDRLIIGLNSDKSVSRIKGETRPLNSENDRARILNALSCVDAVVLFAEDTPAELIKLVKPDVLVKGGDYQVEQIVGREYAGNVKIIDFEEGYSTTDIIEKIRTLIKEGLL